MELVEQSAPFVLFFDIDMLNILIRKYEIRIDKWGWTHPKVFLESAKRQNMKVKELGKEELNELKKRFEKLGQDDLQFYKDLAKVALLGPAGAMNIPMKFIKGLEFQDAESVLLMFVFDVGSFLKKIIFGTVIISNTSEGKENVLKYLRNIVSEAQVHPISEQNWIKTEKTRERMASKAPYVKGFEENLWDEIL